MSNFQMGMSIDNCGGGTDHVIFYQNTRKAFDVDHHKNEIREEINEVFHLIKNFERERDELIQQEIQHHHRRLDNILAILSAVTIPIALVSGLMGMNTSYENCVPMDDQWALFWEYLFTSQRTNASVKSALPCMGFADVLVFCAVLGVIIWVLMRLIMRPKIKK